MELTFIKNIEDYNAYKLLKPVNNYKYKKVQFICSVCNQLKTKVFKALTPDLICSNCTISIAIKKPEIQDKKRDTCQKKYGVDHYNKTNESKERHKQTNLKKYGVEHYTKTNESKEKYKNTCITKYGVDNVFQLQETKDKSKNTSIKKYGVEYYTQTDEYKERYINTCKEKYGVDNVSQDLSVMELKKQTCLKNYGTEFPLQNINILKSTKHKYTYDDKNFDSIPELAYYIWLTDNNISFIYQPKCDILYKHDNKIHYYQPDFLVNNEYIELKGLQFFQDKDPSKQMVNPFDHTLDSLYEAKHQCMLQNNVKILTEIDYDKYIKYVNDRYTKDFLYLFDNKLDFPYLNTDLSDKSDYGLIKHFHKSIYSANRLNKISPLNAWNNKNLVKTIALNRLKYIGHCKPSDILQGMNVTKLAPKVSVFKPKLAERLISSYLNESTIIIDPFSGFSGRLLGSYRCNKQYIGHDINSIHVEESNKIINYLNINNYCSVSVQDILNTDSLDLTNKNTALFTCPPYNLKENWNINETNLCCDEWIDICLKKYQNCKNYLFVVDNTEKYKSNIVETLTNSCHFSTSYEYVILL